MNNLIDVIADAKGEVPVPKEILEALHVMPGDQLRFVLLSNGRVIVHARNRSIRELAGIFYQEGRAPVSIEQMSPWE
ncbi:AbrB/MazE/SpoVT family DNA-binding domain-containing protein [Rugamonas sp.]|uniref:AbrB/MazE/SpoVT family DNA-binding domain-containing protein n=1 Tax=Rugamonas sp. TaxID=1926287 RepID=UPI0025D5E7AC|nr:AbrB/MazE/SpoVT family DNA-binding domain-containing protein [Rugamonas sp.]